MTMPANRINKKKTAHVDGRRQLLIFTNSYATLRGNEKSDCYLTYFHRQNNPLAYDSWSLLRGFCFAFQRFVGTFRLLP